MKPPPREHLLHWLYEAAELEHDLMCTYLYAAFTIKTDAADGITADQAQRAAGWRRAVIEVAIQEMGHLAAVWNLTSALGGSPQFNRGNFPVEPGALPASVIARLAPFDEDALQHFIYLERPGCSREGDGSGFPHSPARFRGNTLASLTPMPLEYETVGVFYATLGDGLRAFVEAHGEETAFCNDPALQLTTEDVGLEGLRPVVCSKSALASLASIVEQGEGAPVDTTDSHFRVFRRLRDELLSARRDELGYEPAFPAARDPVLRPPIDSARIWIHDPEAAATVDLANAMYALMLRMLAYAYEVPRTAPQRRVAIDAALGLMHAMTPVAERAVRLPAGPSHPGIHAGITFTALRDAAALPSGASAWRFFTERLDELVESATRLAASQDPRLLRATRTLGELATRVRRVPAGATSATTISPSSSSTPPPAPPEPAPTTGPRSPLGKRTPGKSLAVLYDGKRCIHARVCVTSLPKVFRVTEGPWIFPDDGEPDRICEIIHGCPSGALHYERADGKVEPMPEVNLIATREKGPYAVRANIQLAGAPPSYRMTLCRCGASKNKPFCDNSHIAANFDATGEPPPTRTDALPERDGPLEIEPERDGPLVVTGNLEIVSGTNHIVARVTRARLCRCGASATKPFCDQSHRRIGFRSDS